MAAIVKYSMKDLIPNLLKALGVILVSSFILFLFYPKDRIKDQVLNTALEVLGNKLLAMVPKEKEREVQEEFDAMRARALEGRVDQDHLEQFAAVVLNAEAEGRPLPQEKIDSSLAALRWAEVRVRQDEKRLQKFAERMHAFEKFQARWEQTMTDSGWAPTLAPFPHRSFYRVEPNFVVKIDTAALARMVGVRVQVHLAESLATVFSRQPPPPMPPRIEVLLREISETSGHLPIELEPHGFVPMPDSFRFEHPLPPPGSTYPVPPVPPVPKSETKAPVGNKKNSP